MNAYKNIMEGLAVFFICFLLFANVRAEEPAMEEWVDVNVLVNLADSNDAKDLEGIIREANATLEKARIRLILKKVNKNYKTGDGDANLTNSEGTNASSDGQKELEKAFGAGKGIKITVADDVLVEEPNTVGWNIHRNPVVFIEKGDSLLQTGQVLAHEIGHFLTLEHVDDSNNLMFPSWPNGQDLNTSQVDEIFKEIKKRGKTYLRKPQPLPSEFELGPSGLEYGIEGFGATLDIPGDVLVTNLSTGTTTESDDPKYKYADLEEILVYMENAFDPSGILNIQLLLGGLLPPPDQTDFFTDIEIFIDENGAAPEFPADATVSIHRSPDGLWDAVLLDSDSVELPLDLPWVSQNERFDTGPKEDLFNLTVELDVPVELINEAMDGRFDPSSSHRILLIGNSWGADYRDDPFLATILQDTTDPFFLNVIGHPAGPELSFIHNGVAGSGFSPNTEVGIWFDSSMIDSTQTIDDGTFFYTLFADLIESEPFSRTGIHSVIAKELDDSGPNGADHAIGFFEVPNPLFLDLDTFLDPIGPVDEFTTNTGVLGGERDFSSQAIGAGATGDFQFTGVSFKGDFDFPESGFGGLDFIYDGTDGNHGLDFRGLGGVDVTNGGVNDEFFLTLYNVEGSWTAQFFIHTDEANFFGTFISPLPTGGPFPREIVIPLSNFKATGNPSFEDIGLIGVFYGNSPAPGEQSTSIELGTGGFRSSESNAVKPVKPFGAIDIPAHGGEASGSAYRCQGWVLTPLPNKIPEDGSTINVYIDGINVGNATYNFYREDIATIFPGFTNSNGAGAYFDFDTTSYENGIHSINWSVTDDAGNTDGIGSRYFVIQNSTQ